MQLRMRETNRCPVSEMKNIEGQGSCVCEFKGCWFKNCAYFQYSVLRARRNGASVRGYMLQSVFIRGVCTPVAAVSVGELVDHLFDTGAKGGKEQASQRTALHERVFGRKEGAGWSRTSS